MSGIVTGAEREAAVAQWLICAVQASERRAVWQDWTQRGAALMPCGVLFSGVKITARTVTAAAGSEDVDAYLARVIQGPVICTQNGRSYVALVGPSVARRWKVPGVSMLGDGAFLGVPRPSLDRASGASAFWAVPFDSPGMLCMGHDVEHVVEAGRRGGPACG
ncbi:hypothetical protein ACFRAR_11090 [Kitasatospora sp. NPDC056651]|uniref:hypothetical protein n=1 Tax=Kitasatospora sp. NPDC056651 TaxID=3345892 RepID=UPI0036982AE6